jgi:hypothetical protein
MAANKTYPCVTADKAAVLIPNGAVVAVSGHRETANRIDQRRFPAPQDGKGIGRKFFGRYAMLLRFLLKTASWISNVESLLTQWWKV